jgi:PAS domain S-box-containing protein
MEEGFILFDRDFTILQVNGATARLVGVPREQLVGRNHWEQFPGTLESGVGRMYQAVLEQGRAQSLEHKYRFADGRERWFEVRAFPVADGVAAVFQDVTERKQLEEEAAHSLERIQLALDAGAIVGTWVWNIPENLFVADERFATSFGLDAARLKSGAPLEYAVEAIHPDDRDRVAETVARALDARGPYRCQYRVLRDGAYRWVEANGRVEPDEHGVPTRFPGVLLDIEDRRRVEDERDHAAALLRTFIEAVPGVVFAKDRQGRYLIANRGAADALGRSPADIVGRTDAEVFPDRSQAAAIMALDNDVMASGTARQVEEFVTRADGKPSIWWSTKEPLRDGAGQVVGLVGTSVDITERKRLEEELRLADRRKDEFLAMLAHELRNPLAPIKTSSHVLKLSATDPERVRATSEVIARQVGHLTRLVDDLLDVSRVTRGLIQLEQQPVDLQTVVSTAVEQVKPLVQSRHHKLHTRMGPGPFKVKGDFHRLVQVLSNLLANAAKYTPPEGLIEVELGIEGDKATLVVTDNGVGIAPEMIEDVFDLFTQAERTPDRSQGGLGIGLALVRSLVQLHGGTVQAMSAGLQQGSSFKVQLPLSDDSLRTAPERTPATPVNSRRVLIVDDNIDAANTLAEVLRLMGHRVATAHDAKSATALVAGQDHWDAFVLDLGLPDVTGYELARRLKAHATARDATFIALTGYGQAHDRTNSKTSGFDHHLVKPVDIGQLNDILSQALPQGTGDPMRH